MKIIGNIIIGLVIVLALGLIGKQYLKEIPTNTMSVEEGSSTLNVVAQKTVEEYNVIILTSANEDGKITPKTIELAFKEAGFFINDNRDMIKPFIKNFKTVTYDVYNLFTTFRKLNVLKLVTKYPTIGLFSPMSMSIYTKKGSNTISISSLSLEAMAKIMGIPVDDEDLVEYVGLIQEALHKALPNGKREKVTYKMQKTTGDLTYTTQLKIKEDADAEDVKDEFEEDFEEALTMNNFIMAGFNDLNYDFDEAGYEEYTFYDVYSICNLSVIYTVSAKHPEAGAFAPCSLYMYNKKGSNTIEMGFPSVYNWIASVAIEDKASLDVLMSAQVTMEKLLTKLVNEK